MNLRIREITDTMPFSRQSMTALIPLLPEADAELDHLIAEVMDRHDALGFLHIVGTALHAERPVSSRHLGESAKLLQQDVLVGNLFLHAVGDDIAEQAVRAMRLGGLPGQTQVLLIVITWEWCAEKGIPFPEDLAMEARGLSKFATSCRKCLGLLCHYALLSGDATARRILFPDTVTPEMAEKLEKTSKVIWDATLEQCRMPFGALIREKPKRTHCVGTVRRSVEEIGRNEPCPCGSGKKYKRCCIEKDSDRLAISSDVAGKTMIEVFSDPAEYLTAKHLEKSSAAELLRIDATKVPFELQAPLLDKFDTFYMIDEAATVLESIPWHDELEDAFMCLTLTAVKKKRINALHRLIAVRGWEASPEEDRLEDAVRFFLAADDPACTLRLLEEFSLKLISCRDEDLLNTAVNDMLYSPFGALSILIARGIYPLLPRQYITLALDFTGHKRALLSLPEDEPFAETMEKLLALDATKEHNKEDQKLREAKHKLDSKAREVRLLETNSAKLEEKLKKLEQEAAERAAAPQKTRREPTTEELAEISKLRQTVANFKESIRQGNAERAASRREMGEILDQNDTLARENKKLAAKAAKAEEYQDEEALYLPFDIAAIQPVRLITFPGKFSKHLSTLPTPISRAAMETLGKLAGGEESAFSSVKRLKGLHEIFSTRIGADHRLLFRLVPEAVEVIALINRRDLDKVLKPLR